MALDKLHQEADTDDGNGECYHKSDKEKKNFIHGSGVPFQNKLGDFKKGRACHNGKRHKEGKFRTCRTAHAREHTTKDGGT